MLNNIKKTLHTYARIFKQNGISNGISVILKIQAKNLMRMGIYYNSATLVSLSAKLGANPNEYTHGGVTLFQYAAMTSSSEMVQLLISKYKAQINAIDKKGNNALFYAIKNNQTELAKILMQHRAKLKYSPSLFLDLFNNKQSVDCFIEAFLHTYKFRTLEHAVWHNDIVAAILLIKNRDFQFTQGAYYSSKMNLLCLAAKYGEHSLLCDLIKEYEININQPPHIRHATVPLHIAVKNGQFETVKILIEKCGADISLLDEKGRTPLHYAVKHYEIFNYLYNREPSLIIHQDYAGNTPLDYANIQANTLEMVCKFIKQNNIDYETYKTWVTKDPQNLLHRVARINNSKAIGELLKRGFPFKCIIKGGIHHFTKR